MKKKIRKILHSKITKRVICGLIVFSMILGIAHLENLKDYLDFEFGVDKEKLILEAIFRDLNRLEKYAETDIKLFERFGIITDYKYLYTQRNYAFFRLEDDYIRIVRIIDERRDFMYILFGVRMESLN